MSEAQRATSPPILKTSRPLPNSPVMLVIPLRREKESAICALSFELHRPVESSIPFRNSH